MAEESSSAIMAKRSEKTQALQREKASLLEREIAMERWRSNLWLVQEALKEARGDLAGGNERAAARVKQLEAERDIAEMTLQDQSRRFLEVEHSVALLSNELADLELKWSDARERERSARNQRSERERTR